MELLACWLEYAAGCREQRLILLLEKCVNTASTCLHGHWTSSLHNADDNLCQLSKALGQNRFARFLEICFSSV